MIRSRKNIIPRPTYRSARAYVGGPEITITNPLIPFGTEYRCGLCSAPWRQGKPIGVEEITPKELSQRCGLSVRRIGRLLQDYRIAHHTSLPTLIPILDWETTWPDEYVWCALCGAVWRTGEHWAHDGLSAKEAGYALGCSPQRIYQSIRTGRIRAICLRTGTWWIPKWELLYSFRSLDLNLEVLDLTQKSEVLDGLDDSPWDLSDERVQDLGSIEMP